MTSPDFWAILGALHGRAECAATVFEMLERGTSGTPPAIMADNYEAAIALLNGFATSAGRAATPDEQADLRTRKSRTSKRDGSQNEAIARGVKAISMIYDMTARIPQLMKQSHLESSEGESSRSFGSSHLG